MTTRTTVRLPEALLRQAKRKAAKNGCTLTSLIEEGLRRVVAKDPPGPGKRMMPRISTARGSLKPGFEWDKLSSQVQEMDDLEYVERMQRFE